MAVCEVLYTQDCSGHIFDCIAAIRGRDTDTVDRPFLYDYSFVFERKILSVQALLSMNF